MRTAKKLHYQRFTAVTSIYFTSDPDNVTVAKQFDAEFVGNPLLMIMRNNPFDDPSISHYCK